jgi:hypothetical protein
MRGDDAICGKLFSYRDLEKRVSSEHPLRTIREIANAALKMRRRVKEQQKPDPLGRINCPRSESRLRASPAPRGRHYSALASAIVGLSGCTAFHA